MADLGTGVGTIWAESGVSDLDPYFRKVTGNAAVAHSVVRRLITPRTTGGEPTLSWAPGVGYDIRSLLNTAVASNSRGPLNVIETVIRSEALGDERVEDATVTVELFGAKRNELRIALMLRTSDGPFSLILAASSLTLTVLSIET